MRRRWWLSIGRSFTTFFIFYLFSHFSTRINLRTQNSVGGVQFFFYLRISSVLSIGYVSSVRTSSVQLPLPFVWLVLLVLPGSVMTLQVLLLLLLIKLIVLLIFGLIGVNGSVPPSLPLWLPLLLLLLLLLLVLLCVWLLFAFGEVAGVSMPKLTKLGRFDFALLLSSLLPMPLAMLPIRILFLLVDVLWFTASGNNFISLFGLRADDIAWLFADADDTVNAFILSKLFADVFNVIKP